MTLKIEVDNNSKRNGAIRGSLYIMDNGEANFRPFHVSEKDPTKKYKQLGHGKISTDSKKTRLCVVINKDEGVDAASAINKECAEANEWLSCDDKIINQ